MQQPQEMQNYEEGNDIVVDGEKIEEVEKFSYLGDVIDCEAGVERTVRTRVMKAWLRWREMKSLLMSQGIRIPLRTRGGVYESCIRSVLLYGSET